MFYAKEFGILANAQKPDGRSPKRGKNKKMKTPLERMTELKEMRDKNLISQVE